MTEIVGIVVPSTVSYAMHLSSSSCLTLPSCEYVNYESYLDLRSVGDLPSQPRPPVPRFMHSITIGKGVVLVLFVTLVVVLALTFVTIRQSLLTV